MVVTQSMSTFVTSCMSWWRPRDHTTLHRPVGRPEWLKYAKCSSLRCRGWTIPWRTSMEAHPLPRVTGTTTLLRAPRHAHPDEAHPHHLGAITVKVAIAASVTCRRVEAVEGVAFTAASLTLGQDQVDTEAHPQEAMENATVLVAMATG